MDQSNQVNLFIFSYNWLRGQFPLEYCSSILSKQEKVQANKFVSSADAVQYMIRKSLIRVVLGHAINCSPQKIQFSFGDWCKPFLSKNHERLVSFNCSDTKEYVVIALSQNVTSQLGIDIESTETEVACCALAKRFFHHDEYQRIQYKQGAELKKDFLSLWTCKEAYIKALGYGLYYGLNNFRVELMADRFIIDDSLDADVYASYYQELDLKLYLAVVSLGQHAAKTKFILAPPNSYQVTYSEL
jgi:4'-phosphopantetheinyl transferase